VLASLAPCAPSGPVGAAGHGPGVGDGVGAAAEAACTKRWAMSTPTLYLIKKRRDDGAQAL